MNTFINIAFPKGGRQIQVEFNDIGKKVFLSREAAEQVLKELEARE